MSLFLSTLSHCSNIDNLQFFLLCDKLKSLEDYDSHMPMNCMERLESEVNLNEYLSWWLTDKQQQQQPQFLATKNMAVVLHSHYLPDLASWDLLFFPRMKFHYKSIIFRMSLKFRSNHWPSCTWFQKVSSITASSSCSNAVKFHKLGRGLLWRENYYQSKRLCKLCYWFSPVTSGHVLICHAFLVHNPNMNEGPRCTWSESWLDPEADTIIISVTPSDKF